MKPIESACLKTELPEEQDTHSLVILHQAVKPLAAQYSAGGGMYGPAGTGCRSYWYGEWRLSQGLPGWPKFYNDLQAALFIAPFFCIFLKYQNNRL